MHPKFDPTAFVNDVKAMGDYPEETRIEVQPLRQHYPELHNWSNLALRFAWADYSQDIEGVGWSSGLNERNNGFLAYIYIRTNNRTLNFGSVPIYADEIDDFGKSEPWLTGVPLPAWAESSGAE